MVYRETAYASGVVNRDTWKSNKLTDLATVSKMFCYSQLKYTMYSVGIVTRWIHLHIAIIIIMFLLTNCIRDQKDFFHFDIFTTHRLSGEYNKIQNKTN